MFIQKEEEVGNSKSIIAFDTNNEDFDLEFLYSVIEMLFLHRESSYPKSNIADLINQYYKKEDI